MAMDIALARWFISPKVITGKITRVIVNPITEGMPHIVVELKGAFEGEYLVLFDTISGSTPEDVTLSFTLNDLSLMETFETINYKSMAEPTTESLDSSVFIWPFLPPADDSPML